MSRINRHTVRVSFHRMKTAANREAAAAVCINTLNTNGRDAVFFLILLQHTSHVESVAMLVRI
jgi:hypothetical protein